MSKEEKLSCHRWVVEIKMAKQNQKIKRNLDVWATKKSAMYIKKYKTHYKVQSSV